MGLLCIKMVEHYNEVANFYGEETRDGILEGYLV